MRKTSASSSSPDSSTLPIDRLPSQQVEAEFHVYGEACTRTRVLSVPVETAVEMAFGGIPVAVMMLTPGDLEDFAWGFSLTEGMIQSGGDIRWVSVEATPAGIRIDTTLAPHRMARYFARRRAMTGRTGCGVCGIEDLASLSPVEDRPVTPPRVSIAAVERAVRALESRQILNAETRSVHAAAWADKDGDVLHLREDVGRHNALDKLIGCLLRNGVDARHGFVVITSRCSFEMVDKVAALGAGMLVAISGPTSLALDKARRLGMSLLGIARNDGVMAFLGQEALLTG